MKAQQGFTFIEFLIFAAVVALLITVAAPNLAATLKGNRENAEVATLLASLSFARRAAFNSGSDVMVCAGAASDACTGGSWASGWTVRYVTPPPGAAPLIRVYPALAGGNRLSNTAGARIVFHANGMTNLSAPAHFTLCDRRGAREARAVSVLISGVAEASKTPGLDVDGSNLSCGAAS